MVDKEPLKDKKEDEDFIDRLKKDEKLNDTIDYVWLHRLEIFFGVLMVIGIILSVFYINLGGALVGLSVGMCFFKEIRRYFNRMSKYYAQEGIFKFSMVVGLALFLLIAVPVFILCLAIGFGVMLVIYSRLNHPKL